MALNASCLTLKIAPAVAKCEYYIDFETNECVKNCSLSSKVPYITNGILYCYPLSSAPTKSIATIDSATYLAADGTSFVFFVLDKSLDQSQSVTIPISKETTQPRLASNGVPRVGASV